MQFEDNAEHSAALLSHRSASGRSFGTRDKNSVSHEKENLNSELRNDQMSRLPVVPQSTFYVDISSDADVSCVDQHSDNSKLESVHSNAAADEKLGIFGSCPRGSGRTPRKSDQMHDNINDLGI